ncbi:MULTISPECIES: DUF1295 domain-containing protein [unclassified Acinetobacter]|uniref:DUF1295 domain-containing protein n=1 Tax=unclassified Acinetobacter TaxID=196816 RepID=UPI002935317B|nr:MULTISPECIES: DUF1295 domain-containing protein [unclassified Acinetobacter]WOE32431.1 DUF1295 domain-containing protein [Acinetobacter sp. SAAs470]WOE37905.1 DUF1295 domain-containing protein [Acinetobacter sp. SAAs474]
MFLSLFLINLLLMLIAWLIVTYNHRAGLVDVMWSCCIACNVIWAAYLSSSAPLLIRLFIGLGSSFWFIRLSWHLLRRYLSETQEDTRYANMRRAMGRYQHWGFLAFFIFQAGLAILFSYPMLTLLSFNETQWQNWMPITLMIAVLILLLALVGETVADQQLYRFKRNPSNQAKTLDQGLWRYSRHPNYFFEWLHWFSYPILALAADVYSLWLYPVLMWLFLYYITGIPFSEQQALQHRADNYAAYQQRTSMFFPWPPKKKSK